MGACVCVCVRVCLVCVGVCVCLCVSACWLLSCVSVLVFALSGSRGVCVGVCVFCVRPALTLARVLACVCLLLCSLLVSWFVFLCYHYPRSSRVSLWIDRVYYALHHWSVIYLSCLRKALIKEIKARTPP